MTIRYSKPERRSAVRYFPITLDIDNSRFRVAMEAMRRASVRLDEARQEHGVRQIAKRLGASVAAGGAFLRLYLVPARANMPPARVSISPMW